MADPIIDAVSEARNVVMTHSEVWWHVIIAFAFGGFTSAIWTWKEARRKPTKGEVFSTFLVSGLIAVVFICLLMKYALPIQLVIAISILSGFSGDIIIRVMARIFVKAATAVFGNSINGPLDAPTTRISDKTADS